MNENKEHYEILTDYHLDTCILDIIKQSKKFCFIVTPYFKKQYWEHLTHVLENASNDKKRIVFIFRKQNDNDKKYNNRDDASGIIEDLNKKYNFDLYFVENLHAKIYLNEESVLITSMNLTDASARNNHEIGCLIRDASTVLQIVHDIIFKEILKNNKKEHIKGMWSEWLDNGQFLELDVGYCIKCKSPIPYNENSPLCSTCNAESTQNEKEMKNGYCMNCGESFQKISMKTPLCYKCYQIKHPK